jgi:hypothetical protein
VIAGDKRNTNYRNKIRNEMKQTCGGGVTFIPSRKKTQNKNKLFPV